jgi:uncharacterized protein
MSSDLLWLLAGGFFAAFAAGLAGFAFALIASGVWYHLLPPTEAAPLVIAASTLMQVGTLLSLRRVVQWRAAAPFLVGGVFGVPLGTLALAHIDARTLGFAVGVLLILYAAWMLARLALRQAPAPMMAGGRGADAAVGFAGGVLGGVGGFSGALPTIWCDLRGWRKDTARGVYQPFILVMQLLALAWAFGAGLFGGGTGERLLLLLPVLALGGWLGVRAFHAATAERYRLVLLALLLASGLSLVA